MYTGKPRAPGPPPTSAPPTKPPEQEQKPVAPGTENKDAMQKRAEERARVPGKFRDSIKHFFFTPTGMLKLLRLGLLIGALVCFISAEAHESYIAITVLEICIVLFFILVYMLTLHHLLICLDWSLLDLVNSFITSVFLILVGAVALQELNRRQLYSTGGILCLIAAFLCIIDTLLVTKNLRIKLKKVLGFKVESKGIPASETERALDKTAEPAPAMAMAPTPAMAKAPTPAMAKAPTPAVSRASTPAMSRVTTPAVSRMTTPAVSRMTTPAASRVTSLEATPGPSRAPSQAPSRAPSRIMKGPPGQV